MERSKLCAVIEAVLFVAGEPVEMAALCEALEASELELSGALDALAADYDFGDRGLRLLRFGERVQLATRPELAPFVERLLQPIQKQSLSHAAMETLAVVAYKQPVTRAEMEAIRGVKCDYSLQSLMYKQLICEVGRKETLGRPILYGTTDAFLRHFCIASLDELPTIDFTLPPEEDALRAPEAEQQHMDMPKEAPEAEDASADTAEATPDSLA